MGKEISGNCPGPFFIHIECSISDMRDFTIPDNADPIFQGSHKSRRSRVLDLAVSSIRTDGAPAEIMTNRTRWAVVPLANRSDIENAVLVGVVGGKLLVTPAALEVEPVDRLAAVVGGELGGRVVVRVPVGLEGWVPEVSGVRVVVNAGDVDVVRGQANLVRA